MGKKLESGWLPILLILLYFSISVYSSKIGVFVDESDNIYGGHLINHGYLIYQDFFSHHAPFPYYWVAWIFKVLVRIYISCPMVNYRSRAYRVVYSDQNNKIQAAYYSFLGSI
jgi:hypothetical protein